MMSVVYRLFFTALLVCVSASSIAQDEPERHYRVELIVVRHLAGSSDSTPQQQLRDLTELLDLYAPGDPTTDKPEPEPPATADLTDPGLAAGLESEEPVAVRVDDMSDTMRETWRRLRGSAGFRPELFRAWEQAGDRPTPDLRIHDDEVLFEIEPDDLLDRLPLDEHGARVFSDQTLQQQGGNPEGMEEAAPTQVYYRIDGSARLTRTRFLHLDVDIELREPLYGLPDPDSGTANGDSGTGMDESADPEVDPASDAGPALATSQGQKTGPAAEASAFRIHRIEQRRQVKAEQMEYFDGPVIGILVLVTGFDVTAPDSATDGTVDGQGPVE
jgi:hypothetical protein